LDDTGQPSTRAGIITDNLPDPYPNKVAAKAANSGALPPDLSIIALGRHGYEVCIICICLRCILQSYIFSLLVGYVDTPAGVTVDEGKAYNPYFPGGIIGMPQQLFDEGIEYKDGLCVSFIFHYCRYRYTGITESTGERCVYIFEMVGRTVSR
jgi:ubiquinol-cytochrome c reductase cytochrome c1 subunit